MSSMKSAEVAPAAAACSRCVYYTARWTWAFYGTLFAPSSNDANETLVQLICFFLTVVIISDYILYILSCLQ